MPVIEMTTMEGANTDEQKQALIQGITDAICSVRGEGLRPHVYVMLREVPGSAWGVGGERVGLEYVKSLTASDQV